jgi:predicted metalloprotease with PDZ domain
MLLNHEHFHTWNAVKMSANSPEGSLFWFTEGFTEYYAATLNFRTGLMDFSDYIEHINGILNDYYTSPFRNEKNEKIQQDLWKNQRLLKLPYDRGFLLALSWDQKIKALGPYSLDDFMRALYKKTQNDKCSLSKDLIEQVASLFLPPETVKKDLEAYVINGETLIPDPNCFDNRCTLEWMEKELDQEKTHLIPQYRFSNDSI